jgi:hypothetical protein
LGVRQRVEEKRKGRIIVQADGVDVITLHSGSCPFLEFGPGIPDHGPQSGIP